MNDPGLWSRSTWLARFARDPCQSFAAVRPDLSHRSFNAPCGKTPSRRSALVEHAYVVLDPGQTSGTGEARYAGAYDGVRDLFHVP
jgi:hypothetical protein